MKLTSISLLHLKIPFKWKFSHSSHIRDQTDSIIAILKSSDELCGFGEGTPRPYVTGENACLSKRAAKLLVPRILDLELDSVHSFFSGLREIGASEVARRCPGAWCCLELALLDLWFKKRKLPVWQLFASNPKRNWARYSAGLPLASEEKLKQLCDQVTLLGITDVKVKLCDIINGIDVITSLRHTLGRDIQIRIDFNEALSPGEALEFVSKVKNFNIAAIEQPVSKHDLIGLRTVARRSPIPIIADESLYVLRSPREFIRRKLCHGVNIRISSCGGLLNSITLLNDAKKVGMITQLGSHIGETAILAAAGRAVIAAWGQPHYLEGAVGRYLLQQDVGREDISFGYSGLSPILTRPGLGIGINEEVFQKWGHFFFRWER